MKTTQKNNSNRAWTLVEVLIVVWMLFLVVGVAGFGIVGAGIMGNAWFTNDSLLGALQADNPNVTKVLKYKRNVYRLSVITVEMKNGTRQTFLLDSNILFNYTLTPTQ